MLDVFDAVLPALLAVEVAFADAVTAAGLPDWAAWVVSLAAVGALVALLTAPLRSLTLQRQRSRMAAQPLVQAAKGSSQRGRERRARVREVYDGFGTGPGAGSLSRQTLAVLTSVTAVVVTASIGALHSSAPWSGLAPELVEPVTQGGQSRQLTFGAGLLAAALMLAGFVLARRAAGTATAQPVVDGPLAVSYPLPAARPGAVPSALLGTGAAMLGGALLLAFAVGHQLTAAALHWRTCRSHRVEVPRNLLQRYAPGALGPGGSPDGVETAVSNRARTVPPVGTAVLPAAGNTRAYPYGYYDDHDWYGQEHQDAEEYEEYRDDEDHEDDTTVTLTREAPEQDAADATRVLDLTAGVWRTATSGTERAAPLAAQRRPPQGLRPGDPTSIGDYQILARIGAGGMGSVYLAQRHGTATQVALKAINPGLLEDDATRLRFLREARTLEHVRGSYTARVLDYGVDGSMPFLVMEYLDGPSLAEYIYRRGPMREPALVEALGLALAESIAAIHGLHVTHRDLKPGNVVLTDAGPKVIDFGIAGTVDQTQLTTNGTVVGTAAYTAPEVLRGWQWGPASDVWAWACCVTFAALGADLFRGGTAVAVAHDILSGGVESRWRPALRGTSEALQSIVAAALCVDPRDRPADGTDLLRRLAGTDTAGTQEIRTAVTEVWGPALDGRG